MTTVYLALQNDLKLLYSWSVTWQLSFNILKCKHLHLGPPHHFEPCHINSLEIDRVLSHKVLSIQFDNQFKFHNHTTEFCSKANRIFGMIKNSFEHLDIWCQSYLQL